MIEVHPKTAGFPVHFTPLQKLVLLRLRDDFHCDIEPAYSLSGPALEAWIEAAEDRLFSTLLGGAL